MIASSCLAIQQKQEMPFVIRRAARNRNVAQPKATQEELLERQNFKTALATLFKSIAAKDGVKTAEHDLTKFLYSSIRLPEGKKTGADCASFLFSGFDNNYTLSKDEVRFIESNSEKTKGILAAQISAPITFVSLGCGPYSSVEFKDIPLIKALDATHYLAIDNNASFAKTAANLVKNTIPSIKVSHLCMDFTQPFNLKTQTQGASVVLSLLGDTIGQYPTDTKSASFADIPLPNLLKNFANATNGKTTALLATLDVEKNQDSLLAKYQGLGMNQLMRTLWHTAKEVLGDSHFDPDAFSYHPEYDPNTSAVRFVHTTRKKTAAHIDGKTYSLPAGTRFIIGCSQKSDPEPILTMCEENGWARIPNLVNGLDTMNTVRLIGVTKITQAIHKTQTLSR